MALPVCSYCERNLYCESKPQCACTHRNDQVSQKCALLGFCCLDRTGPGLCRSSLEAAVLVNRKSTKSRSMCDLDSEDPWTFSMHGQNHQGAQVLAPRSQETS